MKIEQKENRKIKREKERKKKIIVVMASRRRAMKELGRVTLSPDHVRWWLTPGHAYRSPREKEKERESENYLHLMRRQKGRSEKK